MTEPALVLAPLACSVVLLVSGAAKVRDPDGTREAFISMRVPAPLSARPVVRSLPYVELGLGLLLLVTGGWVLALAGAAVTLLFTAYLVLVARVLRDGEQVECHCFGTLGSGHVSAWTLARNCLLVILGGLAVALGAGGQGLLLVADDLGRPGWAWLGMATLVAATAGLVVLPDRQPTPSDDELLEYERQPIPFAMLEGEDGHRTTLRQLAARRPQLLVFMSVGCGACTVVAERMPEWARELGPVEVSGVFTNPLPELPEGLALPGLTRWYDVEQGATQTFAANGRPAAVLLGADGYLAGGPVSGRADVVSFVDDIRAELEAADPPPVDPAHARA